jgi:hypothetical protein
MVALNEAQDISSEEMELLKKFTETGEIHPQGRDNRTRKVYFPIFIMGQWGEWLFRNMDANAINDRYSTLTQDEINRAFMEGKRVFGERFIEPGDSQYGELGAVPYALLQRAVMTGAVIMLRPVSSLVYPEIVRIKVERFVRNARLTNDLQVTVMPTLVDYIAQVAESSGEGPRGLHSITMDFTQVALSKAMGEGMPARGIEVTLDAETHNGATRILVSFQGRTVRLDPDDLRTMKVVSCSAALGAPPIP